MVTLEDSSFISIEMSPPLLKTFKKKKSPFRNYLQGLFGKPS